MTTTETFNTERDSFPFIVTAQLVRRALVPTGAGGVAWTDTADKWAVTIREDLYGGSMALDYHTGTGNRDQNTDEPQTPTAADVLASIGQDVLTALSMPTDDAAAMEHVQDELGWNGDRPSDLLRLVWALADQRDKVTAMLRGTGLDASTWADWAVGLYD